MKKKLSEITVPVGRRNINYVKVSELTESIRIVGLLNPITIDKDDTLVAGAHRLEACKTLGFDEIECIVLDSDELRIELAEIDENLIRNDLDAISMGEKANRRDEILEELGLRAKVGDNQHTGGGADSAPPKTTASIAKEAGVSERVLQENKQLARDLVPEAKEAYRKKAIPKSAALKIARLKPEQQQEAVEQVERGEKTNPAQQQPRRKTVAKEPEPEPEPEPDQKYIQVEQRWEPLIKTMTDWWEKMPTAYRQLTGGGEITGCMQVPVPFHHNMMMALFRKMCDDAGDAGDAGEKMRNNLIAEVKLLADRIDELND